MATKVFWLDDKSAPFARTLEAPAGTEIRFGTGPEVDSLANWAEVIVAGNPEPDLLKGQHLRHVVIPYAGVGEKLRRAALARPHLQVHNSHYNRGMVAQHALALLLACAGRIVATDRALRRGDWGSDTEEASLGVHLAGKVALLLGYGAIGRALEPLLKALGMRVTAYRRSPAADGRIREYGEGELGAALEEADAVLVSLPATPGTVGLLGEAEFARMKPTSIVVNVGRGSVIDEGALYRALREGRIMAAGIDVWYRYPEDREAERVFPSAFPFQELPNVVMTPHTGNDVQGWRLAAAQDVMLTLEALAAGGERNRVDLEAGY